MSTIYTKIINRELPADIVYEDETVIAFLDLAPIRKGHTLVVPKKEFVNLLDGDPEILGHMTEVAQKVAHAVMKVTGAPGVNLHMNNGYEAGQDVMHAHMHVIPRYKRGEIFSVPEHDTYAEGEKKKYGEEIKTAIA